MDGRAVYGHVIGNFFRKVSFLSYGALLKIQNWGRNQIKYQRKTEKIRDLNGKKNEPAIQAGDYTQRML